MPCALVSPRSSLCQLIKSFVRIENGKINSWSSKYLTNTCTRWVMLSAWYINNRRKVFSGDLLSAYQSCTVINFSCTETFFGLLCISIVVGDLYGDKTCFHCFIEYRSGWECSIVLIVGSPHTSGEMEIDSDYILIGSGKATT